MSSVVHVTCFIMQSVPLTFCRCLTKLQKYCQKTWTICSFILVANFLYVFTKYFLYLTFGNGDKEYQIEKKYMKDWVRERERVTENVGLKIKRNKLCMRQIIDRRR